MKKRLMMALAAGAMVAAMVPGVASAGEIQPGGEGGPYSVWTGEFPDPGFIRCLAVEIPAGGLVSLAGERYLNGCVGHLQNQERVLFRAVDA